MNIEDLELDVRSKNALKNAGIDTVEKLMNLEYGELEAIEKIGNKSILKIVWRCLYLQSGRMLEALLEWENQFPGGQAKLMENRIKAEKYDAIVKIINP